MPYLFDDLVTEYGLETVRLWVPDSADVLKEGLLFQRFRGTQAAMKMALKWTGLEEVVLEEEAYGEHFAEFQLGLEGLPKDFSLGAIQALADLAKPVRARLTRLYNSLYDKRHLILDHNQYGNFLSHYSGVKTKEGLQISFGRETNSEIDATLPSLHLAYTLRNKVYTLYNSHIFRCDESILDEDMTEFFDPGFVHEHAFLFEMPHGIATTAIPTTIASLAKSHLILSESDGLDSENTALGAFFVQETGASFVLNDNALSDHLWKQTKTEILERFTDDFESEATHPKSYKTKKIQNSERFSTVTNGTSASVLLHHTNLATRETAYTGAVFWHDHKHVGRKWSAEEPIAVSCYSIFI